MSPYSDTEPAVEELGEPSRLPQSAEVGWWGSAPPQRGGLLRPLAILVERAGLVFKVAGATVLFALALALVLPHRFIATVRFVPEVAPSVLPGGLVGLAGQLGLNLDLSRADRSPVFYAALLEDRALRDQVLQSTIDTAGGLATVLDALRVKGNTPAQRLFNGEAKLQRVVDVRVEVRTNIISVDVEWRNPRVAAEIANAFYRELQEFNATQRASTARATREFLAGRLAQTRAELAGLEDSLQQFLERNRLINDSPELLLQQQRLRRAVDLKTRLVESIQHEHEQARIREVNTTPQLSVIRYAEPPPKKAKPRRKRMVMVSGLLGLAFGVLAAFTADYVGRARRERDPDVASLESAFRQLRARTRSFLDRGSRGPQ